MDGGAWKAAVHGVAQSWTRPSDFNLTFHFSALEKEMATHSSVLAWRIPGMGEPGGLPSMGLHRVGHDWSDLAAAAAAAWITVLWWRGFHNLMKLWALPCRATQDWHIKVKNSEKMWSTGGRNGKSLQYSCLENPRNSMKMQKDMTLEDEPFRSEGIQYINGQEQRAITNSSRKNEVAGRKQKWHCYGCIL